MTPDWVKDIVPFAQAFGPAGGWIILIAGWIYVAKDNDKRECRKELRALVNEIRTLILEIESRACEYFRKPPAESGDLSIKIKGDLQHLAGMLSVAKKINPAFDQDAQLQEFRRRITGQEFDSSTRQPKAPSDRVFLEILHAASNLADNLEEAFNETYTYRMK